MILAPRERIGPLTRVVDRLPAHLVRIFFLKFWKEAGGSNDIAKDQGGVGETENSLRFRGRRINLCPVQEVCRQ